MKDYRYEVEELEKQYQFNEFIGASIHAEPNDPLVREILTDREKATIWQKKYSAYVAQKDLHLGKRSDNLFSSYKEMVIDRFLEKDRAGATEHVVEYIDKIKNIYTTRHSKQPEMWIYEEGIYIPHGETYVEEICRDFFGKGYTTNLKNVVVNKIMADTYIDSQMFFDKQEMYKELVPVKNGLLNIYTGELFGFDPEKIFFFKLPVTYDEDAECKKIISFFNDVLGEKEDLVVLQEFFGFALQRDYKYEKSLLLTGDGGNGKSRIIELMKLMVGVDNCSSMSIHAITENNFGLAQLHKKLLNICGDISNKAISNTSIYKSLTTQEPISADRKFLEPIQFENYAKMVFSANQMPVTNDLSDGFFRRWIIFNFPYSFKSQEEINLADNKEFLKLKNPNIIEEILDDKQLSGLLNWSLAGLKRLRQNKGFSYSNTTAEIKREWLRKADSFYAFCQDSIVEDWNSYIVKNDLQEKYTKYCRRHKTIIQSTRQMKEILSKHYGVASDRKTVGANQEYVWIGIKFVDDSDVNHSVVDVDMTDISDSNLVSFMKKQMQVSDFVEAVHLEERFSSSEISDALQKGQIYEPKPGRYQLL